MQTYHLTDEQKELLEAFARDVLDETICKLSDEEESPLDPYDHHGNFDEAKAKAMLKYIADQLGSFL